MRPALAADRRGISLLEVLISIGILAIGLSSVVALIPAGKSEVARAVILDRSALAAANALADAVTFGLTRPESVQLPNAPIDPNDPTALPAAVIVFDPAGIGAGASYPGAEAAFVKTTGVLSRTGIAPGPAPAAAHSLFLAPRDDLNYIPAPGTQPDDLPRNDVTGGTRTFLGRTTCLISVAKADNTPPMRPGDLAKLSVVTFHNRDLTLPVVAPVPYDPNTGLIAPVAGSYGDRTLKQLIRPGTVIYDPSNPPAQRWCQVAMAAVEPAAGSVFVTFTGQQPTGNAVVILVESTGLAEQLVTLEGTGPYTQ